MSNSINIDSKVYYVSNIRVMAMLCIVIYHSLCFYAGTWGFICADEITPVWRLIAPPIVNLGLTTFVFVSGFLYGHLCAKGYYKDSKRFILKKASRLLLPYLVWGVFQIYCVPGLGKGWGDLLYGMSHLWFLLMLFEIFVLITVLNKFNLTTDSSKKVELMVFILSLLPFFISKYCLNVHSFLCVEISFKYFPLFVAGVYVNKYRLRERMNCKIAAIGSIVGGGFC